MIPLSIDTANTFVGQGRYGFLSPLNDQQSRILPDDNIVLCVNVSLRISKISVTGIILLYDGQNSDWIVGSVRNYYWDMNGTY
jgi:hypothetical protein